MSVELKKKNGNYNSLNWIDNTTVINKSNIQPVSDVLAETSEVIKNSVATVNVSQSEWEEVVANSDYRIIVDHDFDTLDMSYKAYRFEDGMYKEEDLWINILSKSRIEIHNDVPIILKIIFIFDIIK